MLLIGCFVLFQVFCVINWLFCVAFGVFCVIILVFCSCFRCVLCCFRCVLCYSLGVLCCFRCVVSAETATGATVWSSGDIGECGASVWLCGVYGVRHNRLSSVSRD